MALEALGDVRGGYLAKAKAARPGEEAKACRALQAGDLNPDGSVTWPALKWVVPAGSWERAVVGEGDVLVPLRSTRVSATVARGVPERTIAVGHWAVITTRADVLPEYLVWLLGHPKTARQTRHKEVGSKLPFVPLSAMRSLELEIPALELQQRIVEVATLHQAMVELEHQLTEAREHYINAITQAALERSAQSTIRSKG